MINIKDEKPRENIGRPKKTVSKDTRRANKKQGNGDLSSLPVNKTQFVPYPGKSAEIVPLESRGITDNLDDFFQVFPQVFVGELKSGRYDCAGLLEIVADIGRTPKARFADKVVELAPFPVSWENLDYIVSHLSPFGKDNRAGIEATLHRFSCIRNRQGKVVGITARVGRAVYGIVDIIRDVIEENRSILLLGRPGVGKTTLLREVSRVLADEFSRRVVIVDTSNEIAGDGDIPHPGIGSARRMQVPEPSLQHNIMIEAVENHMPEVVVIDEISTEAEAYAARTIAERGVMLVATAHGNILENLLMNPTLSELIGGIQSVTLSDEEAKHRKSQKTILERKAPPTFDVVVEIKDRDTFAIHRDVQWVVDAILRHIEPEPEYRTRVNGTIVVSKPDNPGKLLVLPQRDDLYLNEESRRDLNYGNESTCDLAPAPPSQAIKNNAKIFPYAVSRSRLQKAIDMLGMDVTIVKHWQDADLALTLRGYERNKSSAFQRMRQRDMPIFSVRSNTSVQLQGFLEQYFQIQSPEKKQIIVKETEKAIQTVLDYGKPVNLSPQSAGARRLQHELAKQAGICSQSFGSGDKRYVRFALQQVPDKKEPC